MDTARWLILIVAGFLAVTSLVRLMTSRRNRLYQELQAVAQRERRKAAEKAPQKPPKAGAA